MRVKCILAGFFLAATIPAFSQARPAAELNHSQIVIGAGFSDYASDFLGRIDGTTVWIDWDINRGPSLIRGLGIELEGRDLSFGRTANYPALRQDTAGGGVIYTVRHFNNIHPYGKFLASYGSIDFGHFTPTYSHDTRTAYTPGVGVEFHAMRNLWIREDYEYQFWNNFFRHHAMNPNGFTIGVEYVIGDRRSR
jgi:opacity protein-like surface antigen